MNQEDIIRMAREAGMYQDLNVSWNQSIQNFAALVAAAEREACAKVCDELPAPDIYSDTDKSMWEVTCTDCGDAIRERGETK
jgi:hypothetical protein